MKAVYAEHIPISMASHLTSRFFKVIKGFLLHENQVLFLGLTTLIEGFNSGLQFNLIQA